MYIDTAPIKANGKTYFRHLIRTSYRENGKVKHKTIANLSSCSPDEIQAIKLALKHKIDLSSLVSIKDIESVLQKRIGAVWTLNTIAQRLGITKALGSDTQAKLALLQVFARIIDQGSRLSAVRFAKRHAVCELIGINKLNEDDLYENLDWIADNQEKIEKKLFTLRFPNIVPTLFLYDVTSSYVEGTCNELAAFGYARDGKKGKMQIVVGLLTGPDGSPIAVRVFQGNTQDPKTVSEQVRILAENFGVKEVTLVGDRGMLKGPQIDALPNDFRYITAITKPQIRTMLSEGILQYELFTEDICEVQQDGVRYIMRRNPLRAEQIAQTRRHKFNTLDKMATDLNKYLADHLKASVDVAIKKVITKARKLVIDRWVNIFARERSIHVEKDDAALSSVSLLDGCYVIKSDVPQANADAQILHDRYCDLEKVERAIRTMKTTHLELRPVNVRKEKSTRGHVFVVMLALLLQRELEACWTEFDITVKEGIDELSSIRIEEMHIGNISFQKIPTPDTFGQKLLNALHVQLPSTLKLRNAHVHTKKTLPSERIP
jgi:transposase